MKSESNNQRRPDPRRKKDRMFFRAKRRILTEKTTSEGTISTTPEFTVRGNILSGEKRSCPSPPLSVTSSERRPSTQIWSPSQPVPVVSPTRIPNYNRPRYVVGLSQGRDWTGVYYEQTEVISFTLISLLIWFFIIITNIYPTLVLTRNESKKVKNWKIKKFLLVNK